MDDLHHRLRGPLLAFLADHYSEEELRSLCYARFPPVDADFTLGMPKSKMDRDLVAWCERQGQLPHLLAALREQRPAPFQQKLEPLLEREPPPAPRRRAARRDPRQIFISHAMKQDGDFAQRLARDLARRGWSTWLAPNSIQPGEDWVDAINRGLATSGVFVLALTEHAIESQWVRDETNVAMMWEREGRIKFYPLRVRPYELPETPPLWQVRQQVRFDGDYKAGLQALLTQLDPPGMAALAQQYAQLEAAIRLQNWPRALELGDAIAAAYPDYRDTDAPRAGARRPGAGGAARAAAGAALRTA
jgi:formylglycine-generating enzyme